MTDDYRQTIEEAFPLITEIEDESLREAVYDAWGQTLAETGVDLDTLPWSPTIQAELDLPDERLAEHIADVVDVCLGIAKTIDARRDVDISLDTVIAGAIVHDISKPYEFTDEQIKDRLGHPYYGIHVALEAGLPMDVVHIVLSHTHRTSVVPATLEAEIVNRGDTLAADGIRWKAVDDLRTIR